MVKCGDVEQASIAEARRPVYIYHSLTDHTWAIVTQLVNREIRSQGGCRIFLNRVNVVSLLKLVCSLVEQHNIVNTVLWFNVFILSLGLPVCVCVLNHTVQTSYICCTIGPMSSSVTGGSLGFQFAMGRMT